MAYFRETVPTDTDIVISGDRPIVSKSVVTAENDRNGKIDCVANSLCYVLLFATDEARNHETLFG